MREAAQVTPEELLESFTETAKAYIESGIFDPEAFESLCNSLMTPFGEMAKFDEGLGKYRLYNTLAAPE